MKITKGLIIADPWIGYILDGFKTWEMRSSATSYRGWFGLIRKGTGAIYGVARLTDVGAPPSPDQVIATFEQHRIPEHMVLSGEVAKWNTPWKLADVKRLASPVPYSHPNGAVTWVGLDGGVTEAIGRQLGRLPGNSPIMSNGSLMTQPQAHVTKTTDQQPVASQPPILQSEAEGALIGRVEITQGNIDNNHIYLRSFFDRFPDDAVGGSNRRRKAAREVTIDWGGDIPVKTDLDGSKRFFRARSWIGSFFKLNHAVPGDQVRVEQTGPYAYRIRLQKADRA